MTVKWDKPHRGGGQSPREETEKGWISHACGERSQKTSWRFEMAFEISWGGEKTRISRTQKRG